jgi:hypothetical protein
LQGNEKKIRTFGRRKKCSISFFTISFLIIDVGIVEEAIVRSSDPVHLKEEVIGGQGIPRRRTARCDAK